MRSSDHRAGKLFDWALSALVAGAMAAALAAGTASAAPACPAGEVATAKGCMTVAVAMERIDAIVREAIAKHHLKAVLAGVAIDGQPVSILARGETMTGVPATPDMHFRSGAIAIAYMGTVLLQLRDKGVVALDDKLSKWFPDYPKADQITLAMLVNNSSGYADYVTDKSLWRSIPALDPGRPARHRVRPTDGLRSWHLLVLRPQQFRRAWQGVGEGDRPAARCAYTRGHP
jgi:CubicO group peptidase (beta-lactamase class C family)